MRQFAIIGLSSFGRRVLEELLAFDVDILIVDKKQEVLDRYKERVADTLAADVFDKETVQRIIPASIDAAIVDLGDRLEVSVLVTNYLKQMGVSRIIAKAESDEHGEILEIAGATQVVFPNREAARRIFPSLISPSLFNFLPIGGGLVIAEVQVPEEWVGKSLIQADLRRRFSLNVISVRGKDNSEYEFPAPEYTLRNEDTLLVAGAEDDIISFGGSDAVPGSSRGSLSRLFEQVFRRPPRRRGTSQ